MMKKPTEADIKTAVSDASVTVIFQPTKSTYTFYRLADPNEDVQELAGHANIRTTQRYTDANPKAQVRVVGMV